MARRHSSGARPSGAHTAPPHATFEQAKDAATALLKGDPNRWGILKEGLMAKAREVMPGKDS